MRYRYAACSGAGVRRAAIGWLRGGECRGAVACNVAAVLGSMAELVAIASLAHRLSAISVQAHSAFVSPGNAGIYPATSAAQRFSGPYGYSIKSERALRRPSRH